MKSYYIVFIVFIVVFFLLYQNRKKTVIAAVHHMKKQKKERLLMETMAKEFIGKECIIYTITSNDGQITGVIKEVGDGGILLEDAQGQQQAINLEYVTRIREYPRSKKGKKKSVILD